MVSAQREWVPCQTKLPTPVDSSRTANAQGTKPVTLCRRSSHSASRPAAIGARLVQVLIGSNSQPPPLSVSISQ